MNYTKTYRFTAVFLALLVLFSSLSYTIEKHFCHEETFTSLFGDAANHCDDKADTCHPSESCCTNVVEENAKCCSDTSKYIPGIKVEQLAQKEFKIKHIDIISCVTYSNFITRIKDLKTLPPTHYQPPKAILNFSIVFQIFRI